MLNGEKSPKFEFSSPEKPIAFGQWGEASTAREKVLWYEPLESLMINLLHCVFTINTLRGIGGSRCASVRNCFHWGTPLNSQHCTFLLHWFCIGHIFCWWLWLQIQVISNPLQIPEHCPPCLLVARLSLKSESSREEKEDKVRSMLQQHHNSWKIFNY